MRKLINLSSIAQKSIMAITGGALVLFLAFHGLMNVVSIFSPKDYEDICNFLGAHWYAVIATMLLALLVVIHFVYAFILTLQNLMARGSQRYAVKNNTDTRWAARNMLVLGIIVIGGLFLHLLNFWYEMQLNELLGHEPANGMELIRFIFSKNAYSISYLIWLGALWFHLSHGIWSAFQSMGWNNHSWHRRLEVIGDIVATLVVLMFVAVVIYYWLIFPNIH